jgi:uncharacterized Zn-binding protein involved in type VI secretion
MGGDRIAHAGKAARLDGPGEGGAATIEIEASAAARRGDAAQRGGAIQTGTIMSVSTA